MQPGVLRREQRVDRGPKLAARCQISDANGMVQVQTILPGWYSGRTNHIHLRFRSTYDETETSGSNTMEVFFNRR